MSKSRNEAILENILGAENEILDPRSKIEKLLVQILNQGGISKPSAAGTYALKVTIEDDAPVFEWVTISVE